MRVSGTKAPDGGVVGTMREGVLKLNMLLTGQDDSPNNYVVMINRAGEGGWTTPRHRHNFDQVRMVVEGDYPYAPGKVMPQGWVGYFPESVHYGPQDRPEGLLVLTFQFGGASGQGFLSVERREQANEALKKKGEFKNGIFTYYDENGKRHNKDGSQACFEEATGQPLKFARPRYDDLVLMNPANYDWIASAAPGVSTKLLGVFTERHTRLEFIRLEAGATFEAGMASSIQLTFICEGRVSVKDADYGRHTAFEFLANEGPVAMKALEPTELFQVILPRF